MTDKRAHNRFVCDLKHTSRITKQFAENITGENRECDTVVDS
jgi:hypothetical protein